MPLRRGTADVYWGIGELIGKGYVKSEEGKQELWRHVYVQRGNRGGSGGQPVSKLLSSKPRAWSALY